jgi:hypothetical protein
MNLGDALLAVGFPLESDISVTSGILSNLGGQQGLWQVSIPLNYGDSGGPILNDKYEVVGMIRGGIPQAQGVNFAIPLNLMASLVMGANLMWPPYNKGSGDTALSGLVTIASNAVMHLSDLPEQSTASISQSASAAEIVRYVWAAPGLNLQDHQLDTSKNLA